MNEQQLFCRGRSLCFSLQSLTNIVQNPIENLTLQNVAEWHSAVITFNAMFKEWVNEVNNKVTVRPSL